MEIIDHKSIVNHYIWCKKITDPWPTVSSEAKDYLKVIQWKDSIHADIMYGTDEIEHGIN